MHAPSTQSSNTAVRVCKPAVSVLNADNSISQIGSIDTGRMSMGATLKGDSTISFLRADMRVYQTLIAPSGGLYGESWHVEHPVCVHCQQTSSHARRWVVPVQPALTASPTAQPATTPTQSNPAQPQTPIPSLPSPGHRLPSVRLLGCFLGPVVPCTRGALHQDTRPTCADPRRGVWTAGLSTAVTSAQTWTTVGLAATRAIFPPPQTGGLTASTASARVAATLALATATTTTPVCYWQTSKTAGAYSN